MVNSKRILFISYDGMTDPLGQSQVIPYLKGLAGKGYTFYLLSCEKEQVFENNKAVVEAMLEGTAIHWVPLKYTKKPPVLSTLADIIKLRSKAAAIHRETAIDMVHTRPGVPALVGLWLKKKYRIKFLNDIREFYADSRVEGGMWDTGNYLYKKVYDFFRRQESEQVKFSDGIVCLTHAAEKIIMQWPEYNTDVPLSVIPCSADLELFDPSKVDHNEVSSYRTKFGISSSDIIISYLGSLGGWYMVDEMLRFCKRLSERIPAAKFLFISPHQHQLISEYAAAHHIPQERIIVTGASRREVPGILSLSNYAVFFIKPCYSKQSSSPTKHGEIMAMGIPLITNSGVGDVKEIVENYNSGVVVEQFTNEDFDRAIDTLLSGTFNPLNIRRGATEVYSLHEAVEKYEQIYRQILS